MPPLKKNQAVAIFRQAEVIRLMFYDDIVYNYEKLSCHREAAQCFVSFNISLSHSRSLKVI